MERGKLVGIYVLLAAILVTVIGSVAVGGRYLTTKAKTVDKQMEKLLARDKEEEETKEDDVVIAGEYTIKSTKKISDAYLQEMNKGKEKDADKKIKLSEREQETLEMAKRVIDEVTKENMTNYEKEEAIYKWMCKNISSNDASLVSTGDAKESVSTPYGVLKGHHAVCVGYATTFRLFMQMLGIECKVVHNIDCYHSWDEVKLDGDWYYVDCYMDSSNGNYAYFNMNDDMCSRNERWDHAYFPAAVGTKYNYGVRNAKPCDDIYKILKQIRKNLSKKELVFSFNLGKNVDETKEALLYMMSNKLKDYMDNNTAASCVLSLIETEENEKVFAVSINVNTDGNTEDSRLSVKERRKMDRVFDRLFEGYTGEELSEVGFNEE